LPLAIIFGVEQVREFGLHLLVIVVPWPGPSGSLAALPLDRVTNVGPVLPDTERLI
jgi:hypothetical protein